MPTPVPTVTEPTKTVVYEPPPPLPQGGAANGEGQPTTDLPNAALGQTMCTVGFIGAGVGAVTAIVGAIVWGTAPAAPVQASVSPVAGGAVVQFGGAF